MTEDDVHLLFATIGTIALFLSPIALIFIAILWFGVAHAFSD